MIRVTATAPIRHAERRLHKAAESNRLLIAWVTRYAGWFARDLGRPR